MNKNYAILFALVFSFLLIPSLVSATVTLSVSNVDIQSNVKNLQGRFFVVSVSAAPTSTDEVLFNMKSSETLQKDTGEIANSQVSLRLTGLANSCNYYFDRNAFLLPITEFKKAVSIQRTFAVWDGSSAQSYYDSLPGSTTYLKDKRYSDWFIALPTKITVTAVLGEEIIGLPAKVQQSSPLKTFSVQALLTKNSTSESPIIIGNENAQQNVVVSLGKNNWITWGGNLGSGVECQPSNDVMGTWDVATNKWILTGQASYNDFMNFVQASSIRTWWDNKFIGGTLPTAGILKTYADSLRDSINTRISSSMSSTPILSTPFYTQGSVTVSGDQTQGNVKISVNKLMIFPALQLLLDTNYVGLSILVGKPVINNAYAQPSILQQGQEGTIYVSFKNDALVRGSFSIFADCNAPFSSTTRDYVELDSKQSYQSTLSVFASSSSTTSQTSSCTVKVRENKGEEATVKISLTYQPARTCDPSQTFPDFEKNQILVCNGDGITKSVKDTCANDEKPTKTASGEWICSKEKVDDTDSDGDGIRDVDDRCPTRKGPASNQGCPEEAGNDFDGDGIPDTLDKCPLVAGSIKNDGCPEEKNKFVLPNIPGFEIIVLVGGASVYGYSAYRQRKKVI